MTTIHPLKHQCSCWLQFSSSYNDIFQIQVFKKMSLLKLAQKRLRHSLRCQLSYVFNTLSDNTQFQPAMNTWSTPITSKRELQRQFAKTSVNSGRANLQCVSQSQASLHHHTEVLSCLQNWESNVLPPCYTHAGTPF
jgi:hypothetical protein